MSQPINSDEIIDKGLFTEAIKSADLFLNKAESVRVQLARNLEGSKAYFDSFKGKNSKSLKDLGTETIKVTATLKEYEQTQIGIIEVQKRQAQLKAEVAKTTREEIKLSKDLVKVENDKIKALQKTTGEYKEASNQLNILAKRQKDNVIAGREMSKTAKLVADAHLDMKLKIDKADHSVSDFRRNVGNYPKELKAIQRELQGLQPGTEQFNKLAQKAGLLKDAIGDAKDATKAFATESKATTAKTLIGQIGTDLAGLDFKGASEKSLQFASVVKSISFKEVLTGVKDFGTALLNVGKALLANPFVLVGALIAAVAYATYDLVNSFRALNDTTKTVNDSLDASAKRLEDLGKRQTEYIIRINEAQGKFTKEQAARVRMELNQSEERKTGAKTYARAVTDLAKELNLDLSKLQKGRFSEELKNSALNNVLTQGVSTYYAVKDLNNRKHFNNEIIKLEKQQIIDQKQLIITQSKEKLADAAEEQAAVKKKTKEDNDEKNKNASDDAKNAAIERAKANKDANNELIKIRIENTQLDQKREEYNAINENRLAKESLAETKVNAETKLAISINLDEKLRQELAKINDKYAKEAKDKKDKDVEDARIADEKKEKDFTDSLDKTFKANQEAQAKLTADLAKELKERKDKKDKELKEAAEFSKKIIDLVAKEVAEKSALKQQGFDKEINDAQQNIETQRNLANRGLANTLAEEEARKIQLERQKEEEKLQEIKRQKALAFFKLFASYAEKDPDTALQNALRDTIIAEGVAAAFIDGTENVGQDAQFKGNKFKNGTDGYIAKFDGDERIINPEQNKMIGNLSNEALANLAYNHNNGLLDSAKYGVIQSSDFSSNVANSALLMATMQTNKRLESLELAIVNKPVTQFAFDQYGDFIKDTIEGGFTKRTTYKQEKIRI